LATWGRCVTDCAASKKHLAVATLLCIGWVAEFRQMSWDRLDYVKIGPLVRSSQRKACYTLIGAETNGWKKKALAEFVNDVNFIWSK
jgi:hypothetical protein